VIFSRAIIGFKITEEKESMKILGSRAAKLKRPPAAAPFSLREKIATAAICVFGFQRVFQGNADLIQECLLMCNHLVGK